MPVLSTAQLLAHLRGQTAHVRRTGIADLVFSPAETAWATRNSRFETQQPPAAAACLIRAPARKFGCVKGRTLQTKHTVQLSDWQF
jgi:hypothetical protein